MPRMKRLWKRRPEEFLKNFEQTCSSVVRDGRSTWNVVVFVLTLMRKQVITSFQFSVELLVKPSFFAPFFRGFCDNGFFLHSFSHPVVHHRYASVSRQRILLTCSCVLMLILRVSLDRLLLFPPTLSPFLQTLSRSTSVNTQYKEGDSIIRRDGTVSLYRICCASQVCRTKHKTQLQLSLVRDALCIAIKNATTLYVGNLSFYTTEEQIYEV